jgi:hypothetical protein
MKNIQLNLKDKRYGLLFIYINVYVKMYNVLGD